MVWDKETVEKVYAEIKDKAVRDSDFRKALIDNPRDTIEKMTGEKLPEGFNIKVIENDPAYNATFVLPDLVSGEIEEDNLEEAAGGVSLVVLGSACAAAILGGPCVGDACAAKFNVK
ncbi:MAG TPA: NHLP leader peptide family RiPP precursor [Lachnospiraceae bacterium]|nr:NHLP leader peptide family RiPP precursor [Lachnospiraceae bacterium]